LIETSPPPTCHERAERGFLSIDLSLSPRFDVAASATSTQCLSTTDRHRQEDTQKKREGEGEGEEKAEGEGKKGVYREGERWEEETEEVRDRGRESKEGGLGRERERGRKEVCVNVCE